MLMLDIVSLFLSLCHCYLVQTGVTRAIMCSVCRMVHIKDPLLLFGKSSPGSGSNRFFRPLLVLLVTRWSPLVQSSLAGCQQK